DKERSDAGRRSAAKVPRRGEPKANQSLPSVHYQAKESLGPFFIWRRERFRFEPSVRQGAKRRRTPKRSEGAPQG
ncbi:MAG: hypothetical protein KZQ75_07600, partial [Candidatus Thiodiazotropha sp. (ex Myrtea spinifera)]|nr:hypothetical protein [Candidatus Thiodiazotropha sp. (ex Myrtea spinifera)]